MNRTYAVVVTPVALLALTACTASPQTAPSQPTAASSLSSVPSPSASASPQNKFVGEWTAYGVKMTFKADGTGERVWDYGACDDQICKAESDLTWRLQGNALMYTVDTFGVDDPSGESVFDLGRDAEIEGMTFTVTEEKPGVLHVNMNEQTELDSGIARTPRSGYVCSNKASSHDRAGYCSNFVGKWSVRGSQVELNKDGTGLFQWNHGPCNPGNQDKLVICQGYAQISFTVDQNWVLHGRYDKEWLTARFEGQELPPDTDTTPILTGQTFELRHHADSHVLISQSGEGPGNPYLCDDYAREMSDDPLYHECS